MKFRCYIFILSVLFLGSYLNDEVYSQKTTIVYSVGGLPEGLPEYLKNRFGPSYSFKLKGEPFFDSIFLVHKGKEKNTITNFWIVYLRNNFKYFSYTTVTFIQNDSGDYESKITFKTMTEDELTPLKIILTKSNHLIYNWENAKSEPKVVKEYAYKVGKKLPDLKLVNSIDSTSINNLKDKIVVINWWETSCVPCIMEMSGLNKLVEKYEEVEFISIVGDLKDHANLNKFLLKHPFYYKHYFGNKGIRNILGGTFPRNIILDKNGIIVHNKTGGGKDTYKELEKVILTIQ